MRLETQCMSPASMYWQANPLIAVATTMHPKINVPFKVKCCASFIILGGGPLNVKEERTDEASDFIFYCQIHGFKLQ